MTKEKMTAGQAQSAAAAVIQGHSLTDFIKTHPDYPVDDLMTFWGNVTADIAEPLPPGAHWGVGNEW